MIRMLIAIMCLSVTGCSPVSSNSEIENLIKYERLETLFELDEKQNEMRNTILAAMDNYNDADLGEGYKGYYSQLLSMAGREDIPSLDDVTKSSKNICVPIVSNQTENAIKGIVSQIGTHNLIIINENHAEPRDRVFILNLIKALKGYGFTHFAAETFEDRLSSKGNTFSLVTDGYYSNEPIYGRLLSYVKKEGFELVKYEQTESQLLSDGASISEIIEAREKAQSENLISSVLGSKPNTKLIVHVGHSHVAEIPVVRPGSTNATKWMASILKEKTNINPLTISQTACASPDQEITIASKAINKNGKMVPLVTDYAVGHPEVKFTNNRPDWRRTMGDIEVSIPVEYTEFSELILIEARLEQQPDIAVPIDRLLLRAEDKDIPLLLPVGRYRIEAFNELGRLGNAYTITVKKP